MRKRAESNGKPVSSQRAPTGEAGAQSDMARLAQLIADYAPHDGSFPLGVQGLSANRISRVETVCVRTLRLPSLVITAQGAKRLIVGQKAYEYDASCFNVCSVAMPLAGQVIEASPSAPYLSIRLDLDPHRIAELVLKVFPHGLPPVQERLAVSIAPLDAGIVNAATRLLECLAQPRDVELLAPLILDEILIRLLRSRIGARVAQMGFAESSVQRIAKAISWLRENFSQPMKIEKLAEMVNMSASSFHEHFRSVTSLSPLQYQKALRLQEARRLMLSAVADAHSAAQRVGYLSASQFSREYSRFFGSAPARDIARLRHEDGFSSGPVHAAN
jgi:AraC-like DNA-binding protein